MATATSMHSHQWHVTEDSGGETSTVHIFGKDEHGKSAYWSASGYRPRFTIHIEDISQWTMSVQGHTMLIETLHEWFCRQSYFPLGTDEYVRFDRDDVTYVDDVYEDNTSVNMYGYQGDRTLDVYCFSVASVTKRNSLIRFLRSERGRASSPVGKYGLFDIQAHDHEVTFLRQAVHYCWLSTDDAGDFESIHQLTDPPKSSYTTQMFFDIETFASREGTMECSPTVPDDVIFMIAVHIVKRRDLDTIEEVTQVLYLLPKTASQKGLSMVSDADGTTYKLRRFASEQGMLMCFASLFKEHDVQFVYGYNDSQFDWPYIFDRATYLGIYDEFANTLSRLGDESPAFLTKRVTQTTQAGKREFHVLTCPGVVAIDLLRFVMNFQPSTKYDDHRLDTVLQEELDVRKKDMAYQRLYAAYREKNITELNLVAQYAIGDTLPLDALSKTLDVLDRMAGVADIAVIPIQEVLFRGITNSCTNKIYHKTRSVCYSLPYKPHNTMKRQDSAEDGDSPFYGIMDDDGIDDHDKGIFLCNLKPPCIANMVSYVVSFWKGDHELYDVDDMREAYKFEGATVLKSVPEFITIPVSTLDFEGLYPSLIRTYSFCYTSIIEDLDDEELVQYANEHDGGIEIHTWEVEKIFDTKTEIFFDNMDTAIEGVLRLDPLYEPIRQDAIKTIETAVRLLNPKADSDVDTDREIYHHVLDQLGCESMSPDSLISRKYSYVLYRIVLNCGKLCEKNSPESVKARYLVDKAAQLRRRIQQVRRSWKTKIESDLTPLHSASNTITAFFKPSSSSTSIRFEKRKVQRKAGVVCNAAKILPQIQEELYVYRQKYKKLMKTVAKGSREYRVYDAANLAAKLFANSLYGYLATTIIPAPILAELVTNGGRVSLGRARDYCEVTFPEQASTTLRWTKKEAETFPSFATEGELIWDVSKRGGPLRTIIKGGDSVTGDTPILCMDTKTEKMTYLTIDQLATSEWRPRKDGKEYAFTPYYVWSPNGWVRVHTVIRHKVDKALHRVTTGRGLVDVTEDHSLLLGNGKKIKPIDAGPGTILLHSTLPNTSTAVLTGLSDQQAWFQGYFCAGQIGDNIFRLGGLEDESFMHFIGPDGWEKVAEASRGLIGFCKHYLFGSTSSDHDHTICITKATFLDALYRCDILNAWASTKMAFVRGFCTYQLKRSKNGFQFGDLEHPCRAVLPKWHLSLITHLLDNLHIDWMLESSAEKIMLIFPVKATRRYRVESNEYLTRKGETQYVYDLSTLSGTFGIGPGRMHVSNTDSCFVGFDDIGLEEAIALAMRCADECTHQVFNRPGGCMRFEYEKTSLPTLLGARKNSDAVQFVKDPLTAVEVTAKGNFKKKRSYCQFLKNLGWAYLVGLDLHPNAKPPPSMIPIQNIGGAFGAVLNNQERAVMYRDIVEVIRDFLWRLYKGDVGWPELAIGAQYTGKTNAVTAVGQLASRIIARHDEPLRLGQRFKMVYVFPPRDRSTGTITDAMCGEALDHVMTSDWPYRPHVGYYLRHMYSPLIRNLQIIDAGVAKTIDDLFHNMEALFEQRATGQSDMTKHFERAMSLSGDTSDEAVEKRSVLYGKKYLKRSTLKITKKVDE